MQPLAVYGYSQCVHSKCDQAEPKCIFQWKMHIGSQMLNIKKIKTFC